MRSKRDTQGKLEFQASSLKLTNDYYARYEAISELLDETPKILELVHLDLEAALAAEPSDGNRRRSFVFTSEMVLRLSLCQVLEGASLRGIVVRVDDSHYLRRFTRIYDGPMMSHTALCRLSNAIQPETWKTMNELLAKTAVSGGLVTGTKLRLDTTAVETNIHWPSDSSLLWDGYRTLGRLIQEARVVTPSSVGSGRVHLRRVKRMSVLIARKGRHRGRKAKDLKHLYEKLIRWTEGICDWSAEVAGYLEGQAKRAGAAGTGSRTGTLAAELRHFEILSRRVVWQATERVLEGRAVSNDEKVYSIFEEHTELLKRGKAGKDIEFGHMLQIQQTGEKFITDYEIFERKPFEPGLVGPALESHKKLFGQYPEIIAGDKGYWSADELEKVESKVEVMCIPKKGHRNSDEQQRETDPIFRLAQAFRAGVEGSISFLKRILGLARCMRKGWRNYASAVGATVFAHNLLVLTRC